MSGYLSGVLAILAINIILAYAVFLSTSVGLINLGTAGFAAIGAYVAAWLNAQVGLPIEAAILCGALLSSVTGFLVSFPILRTQGIYIVLATFAFGELVTGIIINIDAVGGASGYPVSAYAPLFVLVVVAAVVAIAVSLLYATRFGLAMRALNDDQAVAMMFGVDVRMTRVAAFSISAFIAGIAGGLYGFHYGYLEVQNFNDMFSIYVLLFVLLGGVQTVWGPLAGAVVFSLLPEALRGSAEWRYVIFGTAIVMFMIFRPQGLMTRGFLSFGSRKAPPKSTA